MQAASARLHSRTADLSRREPALLIRLSERIDPVTKEREGIRRQSPYTRTAAAVIRRQDILPFAIDGKFAGGEWQENEITGCVYTEKGDMYVKIGDGYRPSSFLLGQTADPVAGVCVTPQKA